VPSHRDVSDPTGATHEFAAPLSAGPAHAFAHASPLARLRRFEVGATAVRALAAVAVVVALGAGVLAWRSRPTVAPVAPAPLAATSTPTKLIVAVMGRVRTPGLVQLTEGSRVADAIAAAGGALPETDLSGLNLARKVVDGELITVGMPAPAAGPGQGALLNLNTATAAQLEQLPRVGPVLAQRIVDYRDQHGGFRSVEQLREVTGIGDSTFAELQPLVTV
jgi:competence protein ComEA